MTYTYVNPVIAVFLGWIVLSEAVTLTMMAGMVLILGGVWGVFQDRHRRVLLPSSITKRHEKAQRR